MDVYAQCTEISICCDDHASITDSHSGKEFFFHSTVLFTLKAITDWPYWKCIYTVYVVIFQGCKFCEAS